MGAVEPLSYTLQRCPMRWAMLAVLTLAAAPAMAQYNYGGFSGVGQIPPLPQIGGPSIPAQVVMPHADGLGYSVMQGGRTNYIRSGGYQATIDANPYGYWWRDNQTGTGYMGRNSNGSYGYGTPFYYRRQR